MNAQAAPNVIEALAAQYASKRRKTLDEILATDHRRNVSFASSLKPLAEAGLNVAAIVKAIWASMMRMLRRIAAMFGVELAEPQKTPESIDEAKGAFTAPAEMTDGEQRVQAAAEAADVALARKVKEILADAIDEEKLLAPTGAVYLRLRLIDIGSAIQALREEIRSRTSVLAEMVMAHPEVDPRDVESRVMDLLSSGKSVTSKDSRFGHEMVQAAQGIMDLRDDLLNIEDRFSNYAIWAIQLSRHVGNPQLEGVAREQISRFASPEMASQIEEGGAILVSVEGESPIKLSSLHVNSANSDSNLSASEQGGVDAAPEKVVANVTAALPRSMRFKGAGTADADLAPPKFGRDDVDEGDVQVARQRGG